MGRWPTRPPDRDTDYRRLGETVERCHDCQSHVAPAPNDRRPVRCSLCWAARIEAVLGTWAERSGGASREPRVSGLDAILAAARVPADIPEIKFGIWSFWRVPCRTDADRRFVGAEWLSVLGRVSCLTLHQDEYETVMEDSVRELRRHLPIFRHGRGRVLISGLGLGCVVRGLLAKREVDHIDVVEIEQWIIDHFGAEFAENPRVTIHHGDALKYRWPPSARWDVAWHDIVCVKGDSLTLCHARLVRRFYGRCERQGWCGAGARVARRAMPGYIIAA
jgi:hypothetical protein